MEMQQRIEVIGSILLITNRVFRELIVARNIQ
jgi:hypothetical protein